MLPKEAFQFPKTFTTTNVLDGARTRVFNLDIPGGFIGFIRKMASDWWIDTTIEILIDGQQAFGEPLAKPLGSFDNPVDRNLVVKHNLEVFFNNNSGGDVSFSIFLDGTIYRDK